MIVPGAPFLQPSVGSTQDIWRTLKARHINQRGECEKSSIGRAKAKRRAAADRTPHREYRRKGRRDVASGAPAERAASSASKERERRTPSRIQTRRQARRMPAEALQRSGLRRARAKRESVEAKFECRAVRQNDNRSCVTAIKSAASSSMRIGGARSSNDKETKC